MFPGIDARLEGPEFPKGLKEVLGPGGQIPRPVEPGSEIKQQDKRRGEETEDQGEDVSDFMPRQGQNEPVDAINPNESRP